MQIIESTVEARNVFIPVIVSPLLLWFAIFALATSMFALPLQPFAALIAWAWFIHVHKTIP